MTAWLRREANGQDLIILCLAFFFLDVFYGLFSMFVLVEWVEASFPSRTTNMEITAKNILILVAAVYIEEILFRLPLAGLVRFRFSMRWILSAAAIFSLVFGLCHGGVWNIFTQGVSGFFLSILFLKSGGAQKNEWKAVAVCGTLHTLFDVWVLMIAIKAGVTSF